MNFLNLKSETVGGRFRKQSRHSKYDERKGVITFNEKQREIILSGSMGRRSHEKAIAYNKREISQIIKGQRVKTLTCKGPNLKFQGIQTRAEGGRRTGEKLENLRKTAVLIVIRSMYYV